MHGVPGRGTGNEESSLVDRGSRSRARPASARRPPASRPARGSSCGTASAGPSWDEDWGAVTSESAEEEGARSSSYGFLLDPSPLAAVLRFAPGDATEVAGRPAVRVTATPRPDDGSGLAALFRVGGAGADAIELAVDAERGALLRAEATIDGGPFHRLEVTAIAFGPLAPGTLDLSLPDGVEATAGWFRPLRLELHELSAAGAVLRLRPRSSRRLASAGKPARPGHEHPPVEASVASSTARRDGGYVVTRARARGRRAEPDEWLTWTGGDGLERADAGAHVEPRHHVRLERDGTLVELSGADAELLAQLARALPAPAPPRLGTSEGPLSRALTVSRSRGVARLRAAVAPEPAEALPGALLPALEQHLLDREVVARPRLEPRSRAAGTGCSRRFMPSTTLTSPARVRFLPDLPQRLDGRPRGRHAVDVVRVVRRSRPARTAP